MPHTSVANSGKGSRLGWAINPFSTASRDSANRILDSRYMLIYSEGKVLMGWTHFKMISYSLRFMIMCPWRVTFLDNRLIRPDYWCCCYLQTPTILRHRRPERSETANSSPGSSPAWLAVLCMWTQSTPGCESGCMWPSKWLWACPSNCQEKGKTSSDFSAIINISKLLHDISNSYLPLLNRNVITKACGALILAPYLRNKTHCNVSWLQNKVRNQCFYFSL